MLTAPVLIAVTVAYLGLLFWVAENAFRFW